MARDYKSLYVLVLGDTTIVRVGNDIPLFETSVSAEAFARDTENLTKHKFKAVEFYKFCKNTKGIKSTKEDFYTSMEKSILKNGENYVIKG